MFHLTELEKLFLFFFMELDLIPKLHLLKPNALLSMNCYLSLSINF